MAVTITLFGHLTAGTTPAALATAGATVTSQTAATTLDLPTNPVTPTGYGYQIPVGSSFTVFNGGTGTLTVAPSGTDTYTGTSTVAAQARITFIRNTNTSWIGF